MGRSIGMDVHRDFCEVAIADGGRASSVGRVATGPEQLIWPGICQVETADGPPCGGLFSARGAAGPACCATRGQADMRGSGWPQDRVSS